MALKLYCSCNGYICYRNGSGILHYKATKWKWSHDQHSSSIVTQTLARFGQPYIVTSYNCLHTWHGNNHKLLQLLYTNECKSGFVLSQATINHSPHYATTTQLDLCIYFHYALLSTLTLWEWPPLAHVQCTTHQVLSPSWPQSAGWGEPSLTHSPRSHSASHWCAIGNLRYQRCISIRLGHRTWDLDQCSVLLEGIGASHS